MLAARPQTSCSLEGVDIKGGSFQLLQGGLALEYLCPSGFYPYPVQTRTCRSTGSWSALQTRDQKIVKKAECRGWMEAWEREEWVAGTGQVGATV